MARGDRRQRTQAASSDWRRTAKRAQRLTGEATYRAWRLYMAGSAHGFHTNRLGVYQTLLAKPYRDGTSHLPLTATTGTPRNRLTRVRVARSELPIARQLRARLDNTLTRAGPPTRPRLSKRTRCAAYGRVRRG